VIAYGKLVVSLVVDVLIGRRIYLSVRFSKITGGADDGRVRSPEGQLVVENIVCGQVAASFFIRTMEALIDDCTVLLLTYP
jgi:hypothetical protein